MPKIEALLSYTSHIYTCKCMHPSFTGKKYAFCRGVGRVCLPPTKNVENRVLNSLIISTK
jgi:hypothetical protein